MPQASFVIDSQEPRVLLDRLAYDVNGKGWDFYASAANNFFVDFITDTGILLPYAATEEWWTNAGGNYARLTKADYSIAGSNQWVEHNYPINGSIFLHSLGVNEIVYTNETFPQNRPFFLAFYAYDFGSDVRDHIWIGLGYASDAAIVLRVTSDGNVEIYKNGVFRGNGNITKLKEYPSEFGTQQQKKGDLGRNLSNEFVLLYIIPCRRRDLLVFSNQGGGFVFQFDDIDPEDPAPTITGEGQLTWYVPTGQATVQVAPMLFQTSGVLLSPVFDFRFPPANGASPTISTFFDPPGYGSGTAIASLVEEDGTTSFAADGSLARARIRVDMTGDGLSTPYVYGAQAQFSPVLANTFNSPGIMTAYVKWATLNVSESPGDTKLQVELRAPGELETSGIDRPHTLGNRAFKVTIGSVDCFKGRTDSPKWNESLQDGTRGFTLECQDYWKVLRNYVFKERLILDGVRLGTAVALVLNAAGFTDSQYNISDVDFPLPTVGGESKGEYAFVAEVGDRASEVLEKLRDTYAKPYYMGWVPTSAGMRFRFKHPDELGETASGTLWATVGSAYTGLIANGFSSAYAQASAVYYVYRAYDETTLEPEANEVYTVGRDPRTLLPLLAYSSDEDSIDPTTAPASRPDNWLGEPRDYSFVAPFLISQESVNYANALLRQRLMPVRVMGEWQCEFLLKTNGAPAWRGDVWELDGKGIYRINTLSAQFQSEATAGTVSWGWRPTTYTGERLSALFGVSLALSAPVAFYRMNGASGAGETDTVGGLTLSSNNTVGSGTGIIGNGRTFNGTNQFLNGANNSIYQITADWTVALWVKTNAILTGMPIIGKTGNTNFPPNNIEWYIIERSADSCAQFSVSTDGSTVHSVTSVTALTTSAYALIIAWYNSAEGKTYISVNNDAPSSTTLGASPHTDTSDIWIGKYHLNFDFFWNGSIDAIAFFNVVLSATERTLLYNSGLGREYAGGLWTT